MGCPATKFYFSSFRGLVDAVRTVAGFIVCEVLDEVVMFTEGVEVAEDGGSATVEACEVINLCCGGFSCAARELAVFIPDPQHDLHGLGQPVLLRGTIQGLIRHRVGQHPVETGGIAQKFAGDVDTDRSGAFHPSRLIRGPQQRQCRYQHHWQYFR